MAGFLGEGLAMGLRGLIFGLLLSMSISINALADWAPTDADQVLAAKIENIMTKRCAHTPPPQASYTANVAFLRGSPIDTINAPEAGDRLLWLVGKIGETRH